MTVEDGFDALQQEADASAEQVNEARRRRDVFRVAMGQADDVTDVFPSGSLARGTHIDPIHDVDVVAVFDGAAHPSWGEPGESALEALEHTRSLVTERLGPGGEEEVRLTRLQTHAVKCFLDPPDTDGAFTVDVAPALLHPEQGVIIPESPLDDRDNGTWIRTDPKHLIELTLGRHAEWGQFAKLVRVLKRWNTDHGAHMKSLVVEILALEHLPILGRPDAVARFFAAAQEAVWKPVCDPAGLCGEVQPDMDRPAASEALAVAADDAAKAVEAAARDENERAMCLWRKVFGSIFPEPDSGCAKGGHVVVPPPKRKVVDAPQGQEAL